MVTSRIAVETAVLDKDTIIENINDETDTVLKNLQDLRDACEAEMRDPPTAKSPEVLRRTQQLIADNSPESPSPPLIHPTDADQNLSMQEQITQIRCTVDAIADALIATKFCSTDPLGGSNGPVMPDKIGIDLTPLVVS